MLVTHAHWHIVTAEYSPYDVLYVYYGKISYIIIDFQETTDTRDLPDNLRRRIIEYFKYKYRDGKVRNQEEVLRELPYDMQVCTCHICATFLSVLSQSTRKDA